MTNRTCPYYPHCFDKGECETCDLGKKLTKLTNKIKRLKAQNEALQEENRKLKERIEILTNPNF